MEEQIKKLEQSINTIEQALEQAAKTGAFGLKASALVNADWEYAKNVLFSVLANSKAEAEKMGVVIDEPTEEKQEPELETAE